MARTEEVDRWWPLASFGLITDVHYADIDDGMNYSKTQKRYYRRSLSLVKTAVSDWKSRRGTDGQISFVLDLGDLIDGFNARNRASQSALDTITKAFDEMEVPVYHLWGNHDLYNFTRRQLYEIPQMNEFLSKSCGLNSQRTNCSAYFHFAPAAGYRLVVIDTYEVSMLGVDENSESYKLAEGILRERNRNDDPNSPLGLRSDERRFVKFNGAVSLEQLQWLEDVLQEADQQREVVLVAGHTPLHSSDVICLCWNSESILDVLHRHPSVVAYFAGHTHLRSFARDKHGLYHLIMQGVIETDPDVEAAHGTVNLCREGVVVVDAWSGERREMKIVRKLIN